MIPTGKIIDTLLGYEYRACVKLGTAPNPEEGVRDASQWACVDLRDLRMMGKFGFDRLRIPYRLWVWEKDLEKARIDLKLLG